MAQASHVEGQRAWQLLIHEEADHASRSIDDAKYAGRRIERRVLERGENILSL